MECFIFPCCRKVDEMLNSFKEWVSEVEKKVKNAVTSRREQSQPEESPRPPDEETPTVSEAKISLKLSEIRDSPALRHSSVINDLSTPSNPAELHAPSDNHASIINSPSPQLLEQNLNINERPKTCEKSDEIRILKRTGLNEEFESHSITDNCPPNISEVSSGSAAVGSPIVVVTSSVAEGKVLNTTSLSSRVSSRPRSRPDLNKSYSPCLTLLNTSSEPVHRRSLSPENSLNIISSLSYKAASPGKSSAKSNNKVTSVKSNNRVTSAKSNSSYIPRSHHCSLTKSSKNSTDSDIEEMNYNLGDIICQTDSTPLSDSSIQSMSMDHNLLDHPFAEISPSPTGFATSIISKIRHQTTMLPPNTTNDPSTSIVNLNEKAMSGEPVLPYVDCDVAMRIDSKVSSEVLKYLLEKLLETGLIIIETKGHSGDYYLSITTDVEHFLKGAQNLQLPKRVHPDKGDGSKEFNINDLGTFCPRQTTDGFLTASERHLIVYNMIIKMRMREFTCVDGIEIKENESIVSKLLIKKIVKQIYPLHQPTKQNVLNRLWVWNFVGKQPLNLIRHYFGEEIALYFAWLGFYTYILVIPMFIGLVINFTYDDGDVESADWCFTFYAFFNVIWPTVFLELWKRRSSELAWEWGTLNKHIEQTDTERPEFYGDIGENPITSECEVQYSCHRRQIKQAISLAINLFCLFIVLISMLAVFKYDDYVQVMVSTGAFPAFVPSILRAFVKFTPKILLPITVGILDALYSNIAVSLNDWENYQHQRTYENWLVLKLIMFKFVNSFLALFYIAFYLRDFDKLQEMLAALLITKQIVGNFGEVLGPTVTSWVKTHKHTIADFALRNLGPSVLGPKLKAKLEVYLLQRSIDNNDSSSEELTQVEKESEKPKYECTFDDYLEMFIQMGYVILFSAAYPLAGVWAFLNNVVEIRSDAFKLVNGIQRPFIKRVADIGFWQDAFEVLSVVSIIVNCALIGVRGQIGRWFPQFGVVESMLFIIFLEHIFLAMKYIISRAIPDVPHWVEIEHAKEHYRRLQAHQALENLFRSSGKIKSKLKKKAEEAKDRLDDENWNDGQKDKAV